jgi:hypothetical protein
LVHTQQERGQVFIDKPTETRHQMIVKQYLSHEVGRSENKKGGRLGPPISLVHELEQIIKILISELQSCMSMIIQKEIRTEKEGVVYHVHSTSYSTMYEGIKI